MSGGRDSVALLHALTAAGYRRLVVCHLDHGLRGEAGAEDARFVERLAPSVGCRWRSDAPTCRSSRARRSCHSKPRRARHVTSFSRRQPRRRRCRTLFLAHHADDQVETFLFNLLRGSGPAGLAGMAAESTRTVGRRKLRIIRPLLGVWREEIDAYIDAHRLEWREDATNADPALATRNRLRAEVLPCSNAPWAATCARRSGARRTFSRPRKLDGRVARCRLPERSVPVATLEA